MIENASRQSVIKTYYDRKRIASEEIKENGLVLVYNPRLKNVKLHPKWLGTCKVIGKSDHLFKIAFRAEAKGTLKKWPP